MYPPVATFRERESSVQMQCIPPVSEGISDVGVIPWSGCLSEAQVRDVHTDIQCYLTCSRISPVSYRTELCAERNGMSFCPKVPLLSPSGKG